MGGHTHLSKSERRKLRSLERADRHNRRQIDLIEQATQVTGATQERNAPQPLYAKTEAQGHYMLNITDKQVTFGIGPAGTGKTFVAASMAADKIKSGEIERLIITRPAVEAGESLGFLPGDLSEKYGPYLAPVIGVLERRLGRSHVQGMIRSKKIEGIPLALMRGHSFDDAWIILDEAQNTTVTQMKMFLTRIGSECKAIINGDVEQIDIEGESGLIDAMDRFGVSHYVGISEFTDADVVRSGFVREVLRAYR